MPSPSVSSNCPEISITNDELNLLATLEYVDHFGEAKVYRLSATETLREFSISHSGRQLFARRVTHTYLDIKKTTGYEIKLFSISARYTYEQFQKEYKKAIPMFIIDPKKGLMIISVETPMIPVENQQLIAMV